MSRTAATLKMFLRDIKLAHTIFALPFVIAAVVAALRQNGLLDGEIDAGAIAWKSFWILAATFAARTVAMGFNRLADAKLDALNPRTASRPLPAGTARHSDYALYVGTAAALFVLSAGMLNGLALLLSPAVLAVVCGYSLTKRFTPLTQPMLGLSLALGPLGAWIAVSESLPLASTPLLLSAAVFLWVVGFDLIYACQDLDADKSSPVQSFPKRYGVLAALGISALCHAAMIGFLAALWLGALGGGAVFGIGLGVTVMLVTIEHAIVRPGDLRRVRTAFFHLNALVSVVIATALIVQSLL